KDNGESAELKTRSWSTTKVRILDDEENLSCDESKTTEFGGGSGVLGNPYLICNKEQLELVASNLDKHFKVTKDIDIEDVGRIEGIFKGVFDGNEHILKNHQLQITGDSSLFYKIGGAE